MSVKRWAAPLAVALSLVGCGIAPNVTPRGAGVPGSPTLASPARAAVQGNSRVIADVSGSEQHRELSRHPGMMRARMKVRRLFKRLEAKHPDQADALKEVQGRLEGLSKEQHKALRKLIYDQIKDQTIAQFHRHVRYSMKHPAVLVAFLNKDIDKVLEQSKQEVSPGQQVAPGEQAPTEQPPTEQPPTAQPPIAQPPTQGQEEAQPAL